MKQLYAVPVTDRHAARGAARRSTSCPRATGMTVRNIRAHQSRGLLPPPEVRGAHGLLRRRAPSPARADPRAAGRRLQPRGDQAASWTRRGRLERRGAALHPRARAPFAEERPAVVDRAELAQRLPAEADPRLLARAERSACCGRSARAATRSQPAPAARRRGAGRARRPAGARARRRRDAAPPRRRRGPHVRRAVPRRRVEAVRARPAGPRSAGRRCARRSSGCARSPPRRCWRSSSW